MCYILCSINSLFPTKHSIPLNWANGECRKTFKVTGDSFFTYHGSFSHEFFPRRVTKIYNKTEKYETNAYELDEFQNYILIQHYVHDYVKRHKT